MPCNHECLEGERIQNRVVGEHVFIKRLLISCALDVLRPSAEGFRDFFLLYTFYSDIWLMFL